jgi:transcriptional regulator with XRE-family HTH domain
MCAIRCTPFSRFGPVPEKPVNKIVVFDVARKNMLVMFTLSMYFRTGLKMTSVMPRNKNREASFGKRLIALRKARGITQVELSKTVGTTQRTISYYENEAGLPTVALLGSLARALGVTTDALLGLKPIKLQGSPQKRRLWKRFQRMESLPERDQRAVIRLINSLSASNGHSRVSAHP